MKKPLGVVIGLCLTLLSGFAFGLQCRPWVSELSAAAQANRQVESLAITCDLAGEGALYFSAELNSELVRAQGFVQATFLDARNNIIWSLRRGPWLGSFRGHPIDESFAVPTGASSIRLVAQAESKRADASGSLRFSRINLTAGAAVVAEALDGAVITSPTHARWRLSSIPLRSDAEFVLELRDQTGKLVANRRVRQKSGSNVEVDMGALAVGYYDVQIKLVLADLPSAIWHSALAVLPNGPAPNEARFGIDAALSWYGGASEMVNRSVAMMRLAGIGSVRDRMSWSKVQPTKNSTDWALFRPAADAVAKAGMESVQVFHDAPRWARPGGGEQNDRQPPLDDTAVYAFGRAYALGLGKTVRSVEYWNEQNSDFFPSYPFHYASGFKAFSAGVKSVDPAIRVLIGSASGIPGKFFEEIYKNGVSGFMDTRNEHYYGKDADIDKFSIDNISVTERNGNVSLLPGWLTEMGVTVQRDDAGSWLSSEQEQAAYLVKTYAAGFVSGYERVFFFLWRELVEGDTRTWGIVRDDFTPRPAYVSLAILTRHLAGASVVATENHGSGRTVYFRRSAGNYVAVSWGGGASLSRLAGAISARDIFGKVLSIGGADANGAGPVLVSGITALPSGAQAVTMPSQAVRGAAPLRLSVKALVDGKDEGLSGVNQAVLAIAEGSELVLSGRVFANGQRAVQVGCLAGAGVSITSSARASLASVSGDGEPVSCRFKANLTGIGESYASIKVTSGAAVDVARVALAPDATAHSVAVRTVVSGGTCPRWVARNSANASLSIQFLAQGNTLCPPVSMTSRISRKGETWVFPAAQLQGDVLAGANGIRLRVTNAPGYAAPPTPLLLQLVERTGGIWLVELRAGSDRQVLSGLFNLARAAPWARDDNGRLDLSNVREILVGWGGYAGEPGQQHGFVIDEFGLM